MHRSGTSLVSEIVHRWGAFGRAEDCLPSDKWNARGYWELSPLVDLNARLLREVGASWSCPPSFKDNNRLAGLAGIPKYREEALSLLASMSSEKHGGWFWKDPRLSLLLPFWQQLWSGVHYIICVRDPGEICRSLADRDRLSFPVSILLWQRYMLAILEGTRNAPTLFVSYSALLRNPACECSRLLNFLTEHSDVQLSPNISNMRRVVDGELRHFKVSNNEAPITLTKSQRELQETLDRLADWGDPGAEVNLESYSLPSSWRTILKANLLLLRCQRRWDRLIGDGAEEYPALANCDELEMSHALGRAILDMDAAFTHGAYRSDMFGKLIRPRLRHERSGS